MTMGSPGINEPLELRRLTGPPDDQLIARLAEGDESALAQLYDLYSGVAYGLAVRILGDQGRAEDVLQDAFTKIWRSAPTYDRSRGTLRSWLLTIVRNGAIDLLRGREARDRQAVELPETLPAGSRESDPWQYVSMEMDRTAIREALSDLPREQRQVVELAYWGGYSQREIAEMIRVPLGTVKGRMRLALEKLSSYLDAKGYRDD